MQIELKRVEEEIAKIDAELETRDLAHDKKVLLLKKKAKLQEVFQLQSKILSIQAQKEETQKMAETADDEFKDLCELEIEEFDNQIKEIDKELHEVIHPSDPRNKRPSFLEIRAGTGGQEASLFAADLYKMYLGYATTRGWSVSVDSSATTDAGGFREVILYIHGKDVYKYLKYESGVHRVQRVPKTENAGRIHTSTVTVAVMPEADEVDIKINPSDLRVDVFRSSGAGGQHVNTTDSAVRITHLPTGLAVACQEERSQIKNRAKAMKLLLSRLLDAQVQKQEEERAKARKDQVGSGDRSEKIRTYNFPQNRITDHRIGLTLKKLDLVINGDLDEVFDELMKKENEDIINNASDNLFE